MSCFRTNQKEEISVVFLKNGGELLEELVASFDGRHRVPIASFSAQDIIRATNDIADFVHISENGYLFKGCLGDRPVLVKKFHEELISPRKLNGAINDIVITNEPPQKCNEAHRLLPGIQTPGYGIRRCWK